ncbi:MAG: hypothetical protein K6F73_02175 [Lachnospiraceae bacterium]|nr:hypothetical protein [Lachnospiraceae bacterium]
MITIAAVVLFCAVYGRLIIISISNRWNAFRNCAFIVCLPVAVLTMILSGIVYPALAIIAVTGLGMVLTKDFCSI